MTVLDLESNQLTSVSPLVGLSKLEVLGLYNNRLIDVSALAGLKQLKKLHLQDNPNLTKAEINKLQRALPKCEIYSNANK